MRFLSARLSAKRRHPLAGLVVLLLGLVIAGGLYAAVKPEPAQATSAQEDLVAEGRQLFLVGCSSCHGYNAEGIRTQKGTFLGPSLVGVGAAAVDFQVGTGRMPLTQPGAQAPRKEVIYNDHEIEALAAYVASLGPGPAIPSADQYDYSSLSQEDVVRGGEIWRTNCTACHNFAGSGGALPWGKHAPTLRGVEPRHIYEAMLTGPGQMPVFNDATMTPDDKLKVIGYIKALQSQPAQGGLSLGALGPVSEGLWGWIIGIGGLIIFCIWIGSAGVREK